MVEAASGLSRSTATVENRRTPTECKASARRRVGPQQSRLHRGLAVGRLGSVRSHAVAGCSRPRPRVPRWLGDPIPATDAWGSDTLGIGCWARGAERPGKSRRKDHWSPHGGVSAGCPRARRRGACFAITRNRTSRRSAARPSSSRVPPVRRFNLNPAQLPSRVELLGPWLAAACQRWIY